MKHVKMFMLVMLIPFSLPLQAGGDSSDGHSHEAPAPVPTNQNIAPRTAAATDEFEVVVSLEDKKLVVYVDRFASNEPVVQARVEIDGAGLKGMAGETAPGTYALDVANPLPPARHPLTISIEAGDSVDLLTATLDTSAPVAVETHAHGWSAWSVREISGALLLIAGMLLAVRYYIRFQGRTRKEIR